MYIMKIIYQYYQQLEMFSWRKKQHICNQALSELMECLLMICQCYSTEMKEMLFLSIAVIPEKLCDAC